MQIPNHVNMIQNRRKQKRKRIKYSTKNQSDDYKSKNKCKKGFVDSKIMYNFALAKRKKPVCRAG